MEIQSGRKIQDRHKPKISIGLFVACIFFTGTGKFEFILIALVLLVYIILRNYGIIKKSNQFNFSKSVEDCYINFYLEPGVIDDLAKILISEGDLDVLFNKINDELGDFGFDNSTEFGILEGKSLSELNFQKDLQRILSQFLESKSYLLMREKYIFDNDDNVYMIKIIYFIFSRRYNFKSVAKHIISYKKGDVKNIFLGTNRLSDLDFY
jgi:uncharacterized membrane protein YgaE (UPF0421/DUF939 family)